jgi:hypothetical protein
VLEANPGAVNAMLGSMVYVDEASGVAIVVPAITCSQPAAPVVSLTTDATLVPEL